jgi:transposase
MVEPHQRKQTTDRETYQNAHKKPQLTIAQREEAVKMVQTGMKLGEVAVVFGRSPQCIGRVVKKYNTTGTSQDKPRSGRPPVLSRHQRMLISASSRLEYKQLAEAGMVARSDGTTTKPPSRSTLYRAVKNQ